MNQLLTDSFTSVPIIGILRGYSRDETNGILDAYGSAGLSAIEITLNTPDALNIINEQVARYGAILKIGAGTVCSLKDLENALDAGAGFIVTPILDISVIQRCREVGDAAVVFCQLGVVPVALHQGSFLGIAQFRIAHRKQCDLGPNHRPIGFVQGQQR